MRSLLHLLVPISGTLAGLYRRFDRSREKSEFFRCASQIGNVPVGSLLRSVLLWARSRTAIRPLTGAIDDPLQHRPCSAFRAKKRVSSLPRLIVFRHSTSRVVYARGRIGPSVLSGAVIQSFDAGNSIETCPCASSGSLSSASWRRVEQASFYICTYNGWLVDVDRQLRPWCSLVILIGQMDPPRPHCAHIVTSVISNLNASPGMVSRKSTSRVMNPSMVKPLVTKL
jgi:hypothetical protein